MFPNARHKSALIEMPKKLSLDKKDFYVAPHRGALIEKRRTLAYGYKSTNTIIKTISLYYSVFLTF